MRKRLPALAAALGAALVTAAAALGSSAATRDVSANWSGYAVTANDDSTFTDVTGTWKVPAAACTTGSSSSAAIWVGLGGYNLGSNSLEQTGTSSDCNASGKPSYYIWYELVPAASKNVKLKVAPGDTVTSSVVVNGTSVLVQVKNRTRHTTFTKKLSMASPDVSSAEWIAEAPSECGSFGFCRVVPLTNFGTVNFTGVSALAGGTGGTLTANPGWSVTQIQLVPQGSHRFFGDPESGTGSTGAGATPTAPTSDGRGFSVTWSATSSGATTTTTTPIA